MSRPKRVHIGDRFWRVHKTRVPADRDGDCNWELGRIRVRSSLRGIDLMRVLIHELLHARLWDLDESVVTEFGEVVSAVLDAEGFRQADDHEDY
jgi:hypothetical protein